LISGEKKKTGPLSKRGNKLTSDLYWKGEENENILKKCYLNDEVEFLLRQRLQCAGAQIETAVIPTRLQDKLKNKGDISVHFYAMNAYNGDKVKEELS
jgi:hypothetical protein